MEMFMEMFKDWFIRPAAILTMTVAVSLFFLLFYILMFFPQCPRCESRRVRKTRFLSKRWVESDTNIHIPELKEVEMTRITCLKCKNISFEN